MSVEANKYRSGFSLVEVLIAMCVLAIGIMGVVTMISRSTIQDSRSYFSTQANLIAQEYFEKNASSQYNVVQYNNLSGYNVNRTIDNVQYAMSCAVVNNTPIDNCKEMTCTVSWNNKGLLSSARYVYIYSPKY